MAVTIAERETAPAGDGSPAPGRASARASSSRARPPADGSRARRAVAVHASGTVLLVAAMMVGRATVLPGTQLSVVWPAAGVAGLWLFAARGRQRWVALVPLSLTVFAVNALTGVPALVCLPFVVSNAGQALVFVLLLERIVPDLWGLGGRLGVDRPAVLARTGLVAVVAVTVGTVGVAPLLALVGWPQTAVGTAVWWGRNLAGLLVVFATVHLLARRWREGTTTAPAPAAEVAAMLGTTAVVTGVVFTVPAPLAFLPVLVTVWAAARCDVAWVAAHAALSGGIALAATLADAGPFSLVADASQRAVIGQVYVVVLLVTGLVLAGVRDERSAAVADLGEARDAAAGQAELLESIVATMHEGVLVARVDGEVVLCNRAATEMLRLLGIDASQPLRLGAAPILVHDDRGRPLPDAERPTARALRGETVPPTDLRVEGPSGTVRTFSMSAMPLGAHRGATEGIVLVCRDVTDERAHAAELASFAGVVAHDLKSPLATIGGWAETLRYSLQEDPPPELLSAAGRIAERIYDGSQKMASLIDDLLVHVTSQDRALDLVDVDVAALVSDVTRLRGIEQQVTCDVIPPVRGDAVLMRHLVDNLLGNAVKFVAPGVTPDVRVSAHRHGDRVLIAVEDNGIGVPPAERAVVFQRFRQGRHGYSGTGLGLAICRTIAERLGGSIVLSDPIASTGARIELELPAA